MSEQAEAKRICPYLGMAGDPDSRFGYPESGHRCFVADLENTIPQEHQAAFCLTGRYPACPRFIEPPALPPPALSPVSEVESEVPLKRFSPMQTIGFGLVGLLVGLLTIFGIFYVSRLVTLPSPAPIEPLLPSPTLAATSIPTLPIEATPTPAEVVALFTATPTVTPRPDVQVYDLSPTDADIGWLTSTEARGNHFGDSYLYAGIFQQQLYLSAFQFDLKAIPRGAPIYAASIKLTGLRDDRLARLNDQAADPAVWSLRLLSAEIDSNWRRHGFQEIFNAPVLQTLNPILSMSDLTAGQPYTFELSREQIQILEKRIVDKENPTLSFRLDGPLVGADNLFGWDSGYGPQSQGNKVTLSLLTGLPPATPPSYDFIIVTSTPTPENVVTAAAMQAQITADAASYGTATPLPPNVVTPTPIPDSLVIVSTPIPANKATAQFLVAWATALAATTGTATPLPTDAVTATPTPTASATPTPIPPDYVLITSTPTPDTVFAAATQSAKITAQAQQIGTATPLPSTWVTPLVVTPSPTPFNQATAQALADLATAVAATTGTATPTPSNMVTATPTPVLNLITLLFTPTPTVVPTPTPAGVPPSLIDKILFRSDREWTEEEIKAYQSGGCSENQRLVCPGGREAINYIYVYDPATGDLGRLTNDWPYITARQRDAFSADTVFRAYTKQLLWTNIRDEEGNYTPTIELAIHYYDYKYKQENIVTRMGVGIVYQPVWSPTSNDIAFVATESRNDEIWVINYDGTRARQLTHNTWEWDKSPSWSPDGKQIVFASNRTGNQQLWIMNADGSEQKSLLGWDKWTPYNDWAPVWVKYLDSAPPEDKPR